MLPLHVVLPRTPQVHVGQQARLAALEVVRRHPQVVHADVDPVGRQVRQLHPLGVVGQRDQLDFVVFHLAVRPPGRSGPAARGC